MTFNQCNAFSINVVQLSGGGIAQTHPDYIRSERRSCLFSCLEVTESRRLPEQLCPNSDLSDESCKELMFSLV